MKRFGAFFQALPLTLDKGRWRTLSLKRTVMLGISVGILLPAAVVGTYLAVDSYEREIDLQVTSLLRQYVGMLEKTIPLPLWQMDIMLANSFVRSIMTNPSVVKISVVDATLGSVLVVENPRPRGGTIVREERPIVWSDRVIGRVSIEMSTAQVEQKFLRNLMGVGGALLLQLVASIVLLVLLVELRLMRPLRRLQQDADRLSKGELTLPVIAMREDEMGELALGMDRMRQKLGHHIEEVRDLNAGLEQRVAERTLDLNTANQELLNAMANLEIAQNEIQRAERLAALGALVAGVAHELNTPIGICITVASSLQGMSHQLTRTMQSGMTRSGLNSYVQHANEASDILMRNLEAAATLIGSFKQVAVDRTSSQRRRFSLQEVARHTLQTIGATIRRAHVTVTDDLPEGVFLDSYPGALGQVLSNLLHNALLHAFDENSQGEISLSAHRVSPEQVELVVGDNGFGIPQANLTRIFDPFFTTRLGLGGSGLGLNIVYNLVTDVLGGTIRVESEVAVGTRFILLLPLVAPVEAELE
ncbi:sensor histidine kinase [Rhodoferax sp. PAMC 29310]|uniref:sensor histidine kinase n=1 Tax=Rhodoferax sp. PAMC 29310 TaxID=2822760 RepID=UPI001B325136|nr:ATP-binding protein [Rhodoferax sp. PAMC 29310]